MKDNKVIQLLTDYPFVIGLSIRLFLAWFLPWLLDDGNNWLLPGVAYTDIDYHVFTDAAEYVRNGESPFQRHTYRYTPFLAFLLSKEGINGRYLFCLADALCGKLILVLQQRQQQQTTTQNEELQQQQRQQKNHHHQKNNTTLVTVVGSIITPLPPSVKVTAHIIRIYGSVVRRHNANPSLSIRDRITLPFPVRDVTIVEKNIIRILILIQHSRKPFDPSPVINVNWVPRAKMIIVTLVNPTRKGPPGRPIKSKIWSIWEDAICWPWPIPGIRITP
mmetsp:Transcript_5572/g.9207  ORF Transcript_5572/g.9207 Transcript_5572/m.9207 type:complete len:276 (-) Transcript_5572:2698-3525(-)